MCITAEVYIYVNKMLYLQVNVDNCFLSEHIDNNNKEIVMPNLSKLQDDFLEVLKKESAPVSVFLVNGIKLHGIISEYDDHVIMLKGTIVQMIFKHAVSTVVPGR